MTARPQPRSNRLELACESAAVRWARVHAKDVLKQWDVPESVMDDALLIVSELTTNAVRHSQRPDNPPPWAGRRPIRRFVMTLWCFPDHLQIYVFDEDRTPPMRVTSNPDAIGGRGLALVDELSDAWGYIHPSPRADSGKAVWAQLKFPGDPNPTDIPEEEQRQLPPPRRPEGGQSALRINHSANHA